MLASSNFLVPNTTFVVELVIFLVVLWLLAKYVLPVVNRAMQERQEAIERSISEAEEAKARAKALEEQHARLLEQGREEARRLRDEAAKVGEQLRQELERKGQEEYQRRVASARADIEAAQRKAAEELRSQLAELVIAALERVLRDGISLQDQGRLVEQAIAEVEALSVPAGAPSAPAAQLAGGER